MDDSDMSDIHSRIKALRQDAGLSMEALAAIVGVSWQTIQQWEKPGGTAPKRQRLQKVADALKTTKSFLLDGKQDYLADPIGIYSVRKAHPRDLVQRVCDIAEQIDDIGLRNLIDIAACIAKNHPLTKPKHA
jgi:transcriptional regulator with XRE-family HTH domain